MFLDYLKERYLPEDFAPVTLEQIADRIEDVLKQNKMQLFQTAKGFVTFRYQGDAVIIFDMYVKPEYRKSGEAWKLHNALVRLARSQGKRVAITFSETEGQNRDLGLAAIEAAAFQPMFKTEDIQAFIKGI
jgi:GNAT superfamily N-acetyltransferase